MDDIKSDKDDEIQWYFPETKTECTVGFAYNVNEIENDDVSNYIIYGFDPSNEEKVIKYGICWKDGVKQITILDNDCGQENVNEIED
jgi:hypothetical protein